jgi:hypothetical protein
MRKNSERSRRAFLGRLVFLIALVLAPLSLHSQAAANAPAANAPAANAPAANAPAANAPAANAPASAQLGQDASKNQASAASLGVAAFVELSSAARTALASASPSVAELAAAAALSAQGRPAETSVLATTLALTVHSILEVLPKPEDGGYLLSSPSADIPLYPPSEESLKTCSRLVFGVYSSKEGKVSVDLYLAIAGKDEAEKLGAYSGSYEDIDGYRKALSRMLLPRFSNNATSIVDFSIFPQGASLELTQGNASATQDVVGRGKALFVGSRLFLYGEGGCEVTISGKGYIPQKVVAPIVIDDVYSSIQIRLALDPLSTVSPDLDLKTLSEELNWKNAQAYANSSKQFSAALGRLIVSIPVTALAIGVFYIGYEGYSRSAISETGLLLRGGAALLSAGISIGFVVDTGIRLIRLISAAR